MVGCGVRAGVARPQQPGQGFARRHLGAVQEAVEGVMAERVLPGGGGVLFFGMGDHDSRVEVERQLPG